MYETATQIGSEQFLRRLLETLPRLHAAGVALPFPADDDDLAEDELDTRLTLEERQAVDFPVERLLHELDWKAPRRAELGAASRSRRARRATR